MSNRFARWSRSLRRSRSSLVRRICIVVFVLFLVVFGWGLYRVISYAYESPSLEVSAITVQGVTQIGEGEVLARAGFVAGTNILRLDLDQMRRSIETLRWVRSASVQRIWPREVVITVVERAPIALTRVDGQIYQVDEEGVILSGEVTLGSSPILDGLDLEDREANRGRLEIYRSIVALIGEANVSEVHITEAGEVSVVPADHPILVELGRDHHAERWQKYLSYSAQIRREVPDASRVDMRFEGRVYVQPGGDQPARDLTWDEEAKLL